MNFRAAIFDLDGVIVNTVPLHFKAWKMMFSEYSIEFSFDDYKQKVDGIPRFEGAKAILKDFSDGEIRQACDRKQGYFLKTIEKDDVPTYISTVRLIAELKSHKIMTACISSSKNCKFILKKVGMYKSMQVIVDGTDNVKGKPEPDIFLKAAEKLSCSAGECVVFEDAVLGVKAAKRAGMFCVGVDRYNNPQRLKQADIVVKDLEEINYQTLKNTNHQF